MKYLILLLLTIQLVRSDEIVKYVSTSGTIDLTCGSTTLDTCKSLTAAWSSFLSSHQSGDTLRLVLSDGTYSSDDNSGLLVWGYTVTLESTTSNSPTPNDNTVIINHLVQPIFIVRNTTTTQTSTSITITDINVEFSLINTNASVLQFFSHDDLVVKMNKVYVKFINSTYGSGVIDIQSPDDNIFGDVNVTLNNCNFQNNYGNNGAGILGSTIPTNLVVKESTFSNNYGLTNPGDPSAWHGAFELLGGILTIDNCTFIGNIGTYCGVFYANLAIVTITNTIMNGNRGDVCGAFATDDVKKLTVMDSTFQENYSNYAGGVMLLNRTYGDIVNNNFTYNHAVLAGGVMYSRIGKYNLRGNYMRNNTVQVLGATLYCDEFVSYTLDTDNDWDLNTVSNTDIQRYQGVDCGVVGKTSQSCYFYGDQKMLAEIQNNYFCTVDPFIPNYRYDYIYGVPKGAFAGIGVGIAFIIVSTFILVRYTIRRQAQVLEHFSPKTNQNLLERLID
ncbi:hypothetical protein DLAC_09331 [Tieghemostelium lacteum]|uniref:Right handed beta helix domain-containing protein n=1 Tax=Tieghemostelium lacteum TaxID=361077 RepID=A0A151Z9R4_TIELA|nr:hypothetical protein DLAC_09331 [Tieghemostelium lacteum]|eukprot:KYQ90697.1 hypothetical protein DLAC_09331 [Tieghemostelium lacteum]